MAELPIEATSSSSSPLENLFPGSRMLSGFARLPVVRQASLLLLLAATVALGFSIVLWMKEPNYRTLTGVVTPQQINEVTHLLQAKNIPYKLDEKSGALLVAGDRIHEARMEMAGADVLPGDQKGYEILDGDQGFGVSQFMETTRYRRSLEGELARSVTSINSVRQARVLLAIPKNTIFLRDQRRPTASVSVTLTPGRQLSSDQVNAIMNLVAGAVPSLSAGDVTVIDQSGHLLSAELRQEGFQQTKHQLDYVRQLEKGLQGKIRNILVPMVGANRFTAEVAADVDFTWVEQTEELFNPDLAALRSEQTLEEKRTGGETGGGVPGALSNQPPGNATIPENVENAAAGLNRNSFPSKSKTQATRNFELDRTISHTRHQVGELQRVTVSVVVDDIPVNGEGADAETKYVPWKDLDLERLTLLVKNAIGYDPSRGDMVSVLNSPFVEERAEPIIEPPIWTESWFLELVKLGLGGLGLLILVLGLLRPLFRNLSTGPNNSANDAVLAEIRQLKDEKAAQEAQLLQIEMARTSPVVTSDVLPPIKEPEYGRKLETVKALVSENPARVAQVVQHWITADE